jgi:hypothetical protein
MSDAPKRTPHRFSTSTPALKFTPESAERFAATVFDLADKAVAADARLWELVAELAASGDVAAISEIAALRRTTAPEDILKRLGERGTARAAPKKSKR